MKSKSEVFEILCLDWKSKICWWNVCRDKRIYEHARHLKRADIYNSLGKHNWETNHNFNFKYPKLLIYIQIFFQKRPENVESNIISN